MIACAAAGVVGAEVEVGADDAAVEVDREAEVEADPIIMDHVSVRGSPATWRSAMTTASRDRLSRAVVSLSCTPMATVFSVIRTTIIRGNGLTRLFLAR